MSLQSRTGLYQQHFSELKHPLAQALNALLVISDYARRHVPALQKLMSTDDCLSPISAQDYLSLAEEIPHQSAPQFASALRQFRHYHLLRLLLRELGGLANTVETMTSWSSCADALILRTLSFCEQDLLGRYGQACEESGESAQIYVLAMGKLGGCELNFSSDIDLIIAFSQAGSTTGPEKISNFQYYTKVVQLFIHLLQDVTPEGFVFRVDLRLRPNGDSGALVSSLTAMETYYQEQGRDWERYAMVKARVVGQTMNATDSWFNRLITPFVYRRYVDFSVIESLRSMKAMIEREVQLNPRLNDIKRGLGGIREVEFIIQSIQLIRGGRLPVLRLQNAIKALNAIQNEKLLQRTAALRQAYLFLRKLENYLQMESDQQTHELPLDPIKQAQIAFAMGYESWERLVDRLKQFQRIISTLFHLVLRQVQDYEDSDRLLTNQLSSLWQGHVESTMAVNLLTSLGYQNAERCYQLIHSFRHAPRCRRLNQAVRLRLDRFMVLLLSELAKIDNTEEVLLQVIHLLENIVGRSAYLALLTENPHTLKELLYWFDRSPFITSLLVGHPFLLEILLDQEQHWQPPSRNQLESQLQNQLMHSQEIEVQEEILRQFKLSNWLLAARAELGGYTDEIRIGRFLADVAEVIVTQVVSMACNQLAIKHPDILSVKPQFGIIAYGKLGSREMNYNSDLDLVFIYHEKSQEEGLITRLTKKIVHMLTTRSQSGVLFPVDTRLRPSGEAGLLVSKLSAFVEYQQNQAWTWEHQALIRGRVLFGSQRTRSAFSELKKEVFSIQRSREQILHDVITMRSKMIENVKDDEVKHAPGGLIDLEFLVQFLVLVNPRVLVSRYTHTLSLLQQLAIEKIITNRQLHTISKAYKHFHKMLHQNLLYPGHGMSMSVEQENVLKVTRKLMV